MRIGRDGPYRRFVPIAAYTRGLMLALEFPSVGRPQGDVILGALPLSEWGAWGHYGAQCEHPDNGTAGWFLENFRNLLVMEEGPALWIARGTPRPWLEAGKQISVQNAPTYFGTVAYEIASDADRGTITATIEIRTRRPPQTVLVRLRHPRQILIRRVTVNGQPWKESHPDKEVVELVGLTGKVVVVASY